MTEEEKLAASGKDQRLATVVGREIADLGCPGSEADLANWFEANRAAA